MTTAPYRIAEPAEPSERESERLERLPEDFGHPRGTLAVVIIFGVLFGLAWLSMYVLVFLARGGPY